MDQQVVDTILLSKATAVNLYYIDDLNSDEVKDAIMQCTEDANQ